MINLPPMSEFLFNVPLTAYVLWIGRYSLESHLTHWRSQGSTSGTPGYKVSGVYPLHHSGSFATHEKLPLGGEGVQGRSN